MGGILIKGDFSRYISFPLEMERQGKLSMITVFNWNQTPPRHFNDKLNCDYVLEDHYFSTSNRDVVWTVHIVVIIQNWMGWTADNANRATESATTSCRGNRKERSVSESQLDPKSHSSRCHWPWGLSLPGLCWGSQWRGMAVLRTNGTAAGSGGHCLAAQGLTPQMLMRPGCGLMFVPSFSVWGNKNCYKTNSNLHC